MRGARIKLILIACFATACLFTVSAQQQQKPSSYMPVDIKEPFSAIMARMKAAKAEIMQRQMDLLNDRYDLSRRVSNEVKMFRGKPIPVGPAARLASGVTWESLAETSPEEIREKGIFPKGYLP